MRYLRISKLPVKFDDAMIQDNMYREFKKYGKLYSLAVKGDSSGYKTTILCYATAMDAENACEGFRGKRFMGHTVICEQINSSKIDTETYQILTQHSGDDNHIPRASRTLFIGNLPNSITTKELREMFKKYGHIVDVEVKTSSSFNKTPAYAFMQFSRFDHVNKCIKKMDGYIVGEQRIKCGYGRTVFHRCLVIDTVPSALNSRSRLDEFVRRWSPQKILIDKRHKQAIIYFTNHEDAKNVLYEFRTRILYNGDKIKVDYASDKLINYVQDRIDNKDDYSNKSSSTRDRDRESSNSYRDRARSKSTDRYDGRYSRSDRDRSKSNRHSSKDRDRHDSSSPSSYSTRESSRHKYLEKDRDRESRSDEGSKRDSRESKDDDRRRSSSKNRHHKSSRDRRDRRSSYDKDRHRHGSDRSDRSKSRDRDSRSRSRSRDRNRKSKEYKNSSDDERREDLELKKRQLEEKLRKKQEKKMKKRTGSKEFHGDTREIKKYDDHRDLHRDIDSDNIASPITKTISNETSLMKEPIENFQVTTIDNNLSTTHEKNQTESKPEDKLTHADLSTENSKTETQTSNLTGDISTKDTSQNCKISPASLTESNLALPNSKPGTPLISSIGTPDQVVSGMSQSPLKNAQINAATQAVAGQNAAQSVPNPAPKNADGNAQPSNQPYQPTPQEQEKLKNLPPKHRAKYMAQLQNQHKQVKPQTAPQNLGPPKQTPDQIRNQVFKMLESKEKWSVKEYKVLEEDIVNLRKELAENRKNIRIKKFGPNGEKIEEPARRLTEKELKELDPSYVPIKNILKPFNTEEENNIARPGEIFKAFNVEAPIFEILQKKKEDREKLNLRSGHLGRIKERNSISQNLLNDPDYIQTLKEMENIKLYFECGTQKEGVSKPIEKSLPVALECFQRSSLVEEDIKRLQMMGLDVNNNPERAFYWNEAITERLAFTRLNIIKEIDNHWQLRHNNIITNEIKQNRPFSTFYNYNKMKEFRNAVLSRFNITAITPEEELQLKENMKIAIQRKEQIKTINNQQEVNGTVGGHRVKLQNQVKSELVSQVPTMVTQKSPLAGSRHQNLMSPLGSTISSSSKTTMSIKNEDHLNLKRPLHNQNKPNSLNNINSPTSSTASSQIHNQIHPKKRHRTNFSNQMQANNFNNPNNHNITSLSLPNSLKTHLNRLNLHSKYPHVFQGNLVLKRENSGLDFYYISGNKNLIHQILFNANDRNLPIMQRMKLDHQHMNTLLSKLNANAMKQNADPNFCLLLGVNSLDIAIAKSTNQSLQNLIPAEKIDSLSVEEKQTLFNTSNEKLKTQFIDYLKNKDAAGVVSVNNSQIHIFPKQVNAVEMTLNFHCSDLFSLCEKNAIDYVMVVLNANHGV